MAGNTKTVRHRFSYRQCDDFAAYLNYMARRGWHFREFRSGLVFETGEPENAVYAVEVFTDGSEYDTRPSYKAEIFGEYCEAAGWKFIDQRVKWCVFKRIREDAVPILTDAERLENVTSLYASVKWRDFDLYPILLLLSAWRFLSDLQMYIFSTFWLFVTSLIVLGGIANLYKSLEFHLWRRRSLARISRGEKVFFSRKQYPVLRFCVTAVAYLLLAGATLVALRERHYIYLFTFVLIIAVPTISGVLAGHFRVDATTNQLLNTLLNAFVLLTLFSTLLLSSAMKAPEVPEVPPLAVQDLHPGQETDDTEITRTESIFGSKLYCHLEFGDEYLYYCVYSSEYDWILDAIWTQETKSDWAECASLWNAKEALRTGSGKYWVRYEDKILELRPGTEEILTLDQIGTIRDRLGLR